MNDPNVHRQLIASVASLKSCIRSFLLAVSGNPPAAGSKLPGSISRAKDACSQASKMLSASADQTISLPLETSKRLVEVQLDDLLQQLLASCSPSSTWPQADSEEPVAALAHCCWGDVQLLIASVFEVLSLLCGLAVRACSRSADPMMVLLQLASPKVMAACVAYMEQLWQAHMATAAGEGPAEQGEAASATAATATAASHAFAGVVAAFSSCYSLLAAAVDAHQGLEELELQLVGSLCATRFLPVAVQLLLSASCPAGEQSSSHAFKLHCQQAGWHLLTLALFLSGGDIAISPVGPSSVEVRPGQHIPSSVLAAHMRQQAEQSAGTTAAAAANAGAAVASASIVATEMATGLPLASMQQQLLGPQVLLFLEERLYHAVKEMRGSSSDGSSGSSMTSSGHSSELSRSVAVAAAAATASTPLLLPGRCVPDDQDVLAAALRTLRCWRALLVGPAGPTLPIASSRGVQLLLAVLNGALAESIKDGSSERQALRGRLVRVAVHCLQLLCGCVSQAVLLEQLHSLTVALSGVVSAGGAYWEAHKRVIKSTDLPYTGQVRCVDKATGDMLVRYTMAAQSALLVMGQLVTACKAWPASLGAMSVNEAGAVMLSAGVLPATEQLFRLIPVVSPAHVAAADLLIHVLPLCGNAVGSGQLPLVSSLRKFLVKSAGVPEPDKTAAVATAVKLADLLGRLASCCAAAPGCSQGGLLVQHLAAHLLPAFQVFCAAVLKGPVPAPCSCSLAADGIITLPELTAQLSSSPGPSCHLYPVLLFTYQQLAALARLQPGLGLLEMLLGSQVLQTAAAIISSNYWASPLAASAAVQPGNASLTAQHAAQLTTSLLETLLAAAQLPGAPSTSPLLHASVSDDCLCAVRASAGGTPCAVGNLRCGLDGVCSCCSPRACSDVTPSTGVAADVRLDAPAQLAAPGQQGVQPLLVVSALLQSKLLPEAHKLLQVLPNPTAGVGLPEAGSFSGSISRQGSSIAAASQAVPVPTRMGSGQLYSRDSTTRLGGHSPTFSMLNPQGLRSPSSGTQQFLSGYTGSEPPGYAAPSSGSSSNLRAVAAGQSRLAAGAQRNPDGAGPDGGAAVGVPGSSPRAVDGDCGGLLRGGSWSSVHVAWMNSGSAGQADVRLMRNSSGGLSSSASLASLNRAGSTDVLEGRTGSGSRNAGRGRNALSLQLRLQAVLIAAGQAVIDLVDSTSGAGGLPVGRVSSTGGGSFAGSDVGPKSMPSSWSAAVPQPLVSLQLRPRSSHSGSIGGAFPPGHDGVDVLAGLRASVAAAKPAATVALAAGSVREGRAARTGSTGSAAEQQPASPDVMEGCSNDILFPVDLGLSQLNIEQPSVAAAPQGGLSPVAASMSAAAPPVSPAAGNSVDEACGLLKDEVVRGVVVGAQAAAALLARACPPAQDTEQCWHELLARLSPRPVGCWNVACVNMAGPSERGASAKPCGNCKVAAFCSKGCEKSAWSSHIVVCGKLAAAAVQQA